MRGYRGDLFAEHDPLDRRRAPLVGSQVTSAAHILGLPFAASNLPGMPVRKRCSTSSFSTPITLSYGPLMPTSVW